MSTRQQRLTARNEECRRLFYSIQAKNKKWRVDAVVEEVAGKMFLSSRTVEAIISHEGIYNDAKQPKKDQLKLF